MHGTTSLIARNPIRRRLPRRLETELAKLFCTLGFADYGAVLWDLAKRPDAECAGAAAAPKVSDEIMRQIAEQAVHDPCVLSAGAAAVAHLPQIDASTLDHIGLDVKGLFDAAGNRPDVVVMVGHRTSTEAEIFRRLRQGIDTTGLRTLVIVLEEASPAAAPPSRDGVTVLHWRDHCRDASAEDPRLLAMFVHALGPAAIVVGPARAAHHMLARFARALHPFHRLVALADTEDLTPVRQSGLLRRLRPILPYVTLVSASPSVARELATKLGLPEGDILVVGEGEAAYRAIASDRSDRRSARDLEVSRRLLGLKDGGNGLPPAPVAAPARRPEVDVSVVLLCHHEGALTVPALASLGDLLTTARAAGVRVEARAVLDQGDGATASRLDHCGWLDGVTHVAFGDPGPSRNVGAEAARGHYCAFIDGDDLWGAPWLLRAFRVAEGGGVREAIWHPQYIYLFHESDGEIVSRTERPDPHVRSCYLQQGASTAPGFDPRALLLDNLWSANAFAPRELFLKVPYRASSFEAQHGIEDWRWNLETLGLGLPHLVVPDTVHIIRVKDGDSMSKRHEAKDLLPILA